MAKKTPPIDARAEAQRLIAEFRGYTQNVSPFFQSEFYKHVLDVKRLIPELDPELVAHIERNVGIREEWVSYVDNNGKKRRCKGMVRGYALHVHFHPQVQMAAMVNSLKGFCKDFGLSGIQIGNKTIVNAEE